MLDNENDKFASDVNGVGNPTAGGVVNGDSLKGRAPNGNSLPGGILNDDSLSGRAINGNASSSGGVNESSLNGASNGETNAPQAADPMRYSPQANTHPWQAGFSTYPQTPPIGWNNQAQPVFGQNQNPFIPPYSNWQQNPNFTAQHYPGAAPIHHQVFGQSPNTQSSPIHNMNLGSNVHNPSGINDRERHEELKTAAFYNEKYRKPGKGRMKGLIAPMLVVSILSSIFGGAITGSLLMLSGARVANSGIQEQDQQVALGQNETVRRVEILDRTSDPVTAVAEKAGPSVVGINVEFTVNDSFFGSQRSGGQGSGIIISSDGYILTNNHVVEAAANLGTSGTRFSSAGRITVILPNNIEKEYEATIVGLDEKTDIAVIKIEAKGLPAAEMGDSDALRVGEMAIAIGNPAGLEYMGSVTAGIVSGLNRRVDTGDGKMLRLIQTDAAISPGNSGGALLNSLGQVIGVNSSKIGGSSFEGLGFAIPIKDAMEIAESLMRDGMVVRPQIGVSIDSSFNSEIANANNVPEGALVADVMEGSAADDAGVRRFDIITAFNGVTITSFDELEEQKNLFEPGDRVTLSVYRIPEGAQSSEGRTIILQMTLGSTADARQ